MSVHPMPTQGNPKLVEKIVAIPTNSRSVWNKERVMWIAKVYVSIYEEPVFTSMPCFTPSGATCICEQWMSRHGYMIAPGFPAKSPV